MAIIQPTFKIQIQDPSERFDQGVARDLYRALKIPEELEPEKEATANLSLFCECHLQGLQYQYFKSVLLDKASNRQKLADSKTGGQYVQALKETEGMLKRIVRSRYRGAIVVFDCRRDGLEPMAATFGRFPWGLHGPDDHELLKVTNDGREYAVTAWANILQRISDARAGRL